MPIGACNTHAPPYGSIHGWLYSERYTPSPAMHMTMRHTPAAQLSVAADAEKKRVLAKSMVEAHKAMASRRHKDELEGERQQTRAAQGRAAALASTRDEAGGPIEDGKDSRTQLAETIVQSALCAVSPARPRWLLRSSVERCVLPRSSCRPSREWCRRCADLPP